MPRLLSAGCSSVSNSGVKNGSAIITPSKIHATIIVMNLKSDEMRIYLNISILLHYCNKLNAIAVNYEKIAGWKENVAE